MEDRDRNGMTDDGGLDPSDREGADRDRAAPGWLLGLLGLFAAPVALALGLAQPGAAHAQDIQAFKPATAGINYISVDGAAIVEPGAFVPGVVFSYGRKPLVRRDDRGEIVTELVEDLTTIDLMLAVGLHDRVEVGLDVPISYSVAGDTPGFDDGAGLGDLRLLSKFVALDPRDFGGLGIALAAPMAFPTGDGGVTSARKFVFNPEAVVEYRGDGFRVAVNGGYRYKPSADSTDPFLAVGSGITYGAGLGVDLGTPAVQAIAEAYGTIYEDIDDQEGGPRPLEALGGVRVDSAATGLTLTLAAGSGVINDYGAPELRVVGGVAWRLPEQRAAVGGGGGVTTLRGGDADGDGVSDLVDACPDEPEDRDRFQDADGCPDPDNDFDRIADVDDACPVEAEDRDGFEDDDGCPELDNDQDGFADLVDRCPLEAENKNGHRDTDGCPDAELVRVEADRIRILRAVYFDTDEASIQPGSFEVLDQVAEVLQHDESIERVRIEGHTDARGDAGYNRDLAERRAAAVLQYLLARGIAPDRVDSRGYGEDRPAAEQATVGAYARNRRVEFRILARGGRTYESGEAPVDDAQPVAPAAAAPRAAPTSRVAPTLEAPARAAAPASAEPAAGTARLDGIDFDGRADALHLTLRTRGPDAELRAVPSLDEGGDVLVVHVHGLVTERRWPMWYDRLLVRSVVFPSKIHPDTAAVRMRLTRPMTPADLGGVALTAADGGLLLRIARPSDEGAGLEGTSAAAR